MNSIRQSQFERSKDHLYIRLLGSSCDCQRRLVLLFSDYRQKYGYEQGLKGDEMLFSETCRGAGDYMPMALFIFENIPLSLLAEVASASLEASCLLHWQISSSDKPAKAVWIWSPHPKKENLMRRSGTESFVRGGDFTCPGVLFALATVDSSTHNEWM